MKNSSLNIFLLPSFAESLSREKKRIAFLKRELEDAQADLNIARN